MQVRSSIIFKGRRGNIKRLPADPQLLIASPITMQWRLIDDNALQFRAWNGEFVVYNVLSGDTHVLEMPAAEILQLLQQGPMDPSSMARSLADKWQCEPDQTFLNELEMTLSEMRTLSLVEHG
jgi:PqqD family protein of HPr-rel-A system